MTDSSTWAPPPAAFHRPRRRTWWSALVLVVLLAAALLVVFLPSSEAVVPGHRINCGNAFTGVTTSSETYEARYIRKLISDVEAGRRPSQGDPNEPAKTKAAGARCNSTGKTRLIIGGVLLVAALLGSLGLNSYEVARVRRRI